MDLYYIDDDYNEYLRDIEKSIYITTHNYKRPYAGIILTINNLDYYVPLSSWKPKHEKMKDSITFMKIGNNKTSVLNFNRMIPVPYEKVSIIDTKIYQSDDIDTIKYKHLLQSQLKWLNNNSDKIEKTAKNLYNIITSNSKNDRLRSYCNDFVQLENRYEQYINDYLSIGDDPPSKSR